MEFVNIGDKFEHTSGRVFTVVGMTLELHPEFNTNAVDVLVKMQSDNGQEWNVPAAILSKHLANGLRRLQA